MRTDWKPPRLAGRYSVRTMVERVETMPSIEAFSSALEALERTQPKAVAVWVATDSRLPRHVRDDPRHGGLESIAIATAERTVAFAATDDRVPALLQRWLGALSESFVVMHGAHDVLLRLATTTNASQPAQLRRLGCTQVATALLSAGTRRGRDLPTLEECCEKVLKQTLPPDESLLGSSCDAAGHRASVLLPLMRALTPMLRKRELTRVFALECEVLPAVVQMERTGFAVDAAQFERMSAQWQTEREQTADPARIPRLDKLISTYGYWGREHIRGGRIRCRLHPLATDSGRFSCTDPNLQQVPSDHTAPGFRACFEAPPEHVLVVADYAQIELRVAAHLAPCDAMREVFAQGRDPHRATAATIAGKDERDVTEHERKLAKAVNFGFLFGMGAARFRSYAADGYGVELSASEANEARTAFLRTFPGIAAWHGRVGKLGRTAGPVTVRTALGRRKRFVPGKFSFNAALNIPVQGTAAEGFKRAMIELRPALEDLGGRGVMVVHDEYIAEVPVAVAEQACARVREIMSTSMASVVHTVPIEVEAQVVPAWGQPPKVSDT